jgi:hypothetical protein
MTHEGSMVACVPAFGLWDGTCFMVAARLPLGFAMVVDIVQICALLFSVKEQFTKCAAMQVSSLLSPHTSHRRRHPLHILCFQSSCIALIFSS